MARRPHKIWLHLFSWILCDCDASVVVVYKSGLWVYKHTSTSVWNTMWPNGLVQICMQITQQKLNTWQKQPSCCPTGSFLYLTRLKPWLETVANIANQKPPHSPITIFWLLLSSLAKLEGGFTLWNWLWFQTAAKQLAIYFWHRFAKIEIVSLTLTIFG